MTGEKANRKSEEDINDMAFRELREYIQDLVLDLEAKYPELELIECNEDESKINKLIDLLESRVLVGLVTKGQKSARTMQKELLQIERRKQQSNGKISTTLSGLHDLRHKLSQKEPTYEFLNNAYSEMCGLNSQFFDSYFRNKYRDSTTSRTLLRAQHFVFAKELPTLLNQAIEKIEIVLENQKKSQTKHLNLAGVEKLAKDLFEKEIDQKSNGEVTKRYHQIIALRSKKNRLLLKSPNIIPVQKLPWKFFPQDQWTVEQIVKEFGKYVSNNEILDETRIWKIYDNLNPSDCYIGQDGFNRYIAFCFNWTDKVVLECPIYGNAIYIINGEWKEITKLSKWKARSSHQVTVIRHSTNWFNRLKNNLKYSSY